MPKGVPNGTKGVKRPGSGRKSYAYERGLKETLDKCFTPEDREMLFDTLKTKARKGDTKAAELCLAYLYGRPKAEVGVSATDGKITITLGLGT